MTIVHSQPEENKKHFLPELQESVQEYKETKSAPAVDSYEVDVIGQLHANVAKIQELSSRMSFMMNELSTLIKKR